MKEEIDDFLSPSFEKLISDLMEKNYGILDDFLDSASTKTILECLTDLQQKGDLRPAGVGHGNGFQKNAEIRGDQILWLEKDTAPSVTNLFLHKMETLIRYLNRTCYTGIRDYEAHFAIYPPGSYYKRHLDQFKDNGNRIFTFIFYLNFNWQEAHGGELKLYFPQGDVESTMRVSPIAGRIVCFRSDEIPHEVLLTHHSRASITGWWLDKEKNLSFLS